jgi:hypothetical protein
MTTVLVVDVDGVVQSHHTDTAVADVDVTGYLEGRLERVLRVALGQDGVDVASLYFDPTVEEPNGWATRMTGALCGSFVLVSGLCAFVMDDLRAAAVVEVVREK